MGEHWSWSTEAIDLAADDRIEASLYNHPDVGCQYHKCSCLDCPYQECWEIIGQIKFRRENDIRALLQARGD